MTHPRLPALLATLLSLAALPTSAETNADVAHIKLPAGFVAELVAGPPLVEHPMSACFDDRGRLYVTESSGGNEKFEQLQQNPQGKVLLLEDADGDGAFDKRTVFADRFTFPSGVLWHDGAVYVTAPPGLWRLRDTNGDGAADERVEIVTGFGSTGNAADLHGPYLGPEGWLYFCDGRNGHDLTLGDGTPWRGKAACVYRCRTDGSGLEVVFGGGFDNPVEVAFTPAGEPLVNVNLFTASPHRIDAIVYGIEGGNYPYEKSWRELPRTGDFLPSVGELGWVATSGFMRYSGAALGERYAGRYFGTEFNTRKVRSHVVARDGAGFRVVHEEFLTSDEPDFRPTDVLQDPADGSLLVVDTGGWFRIGCPQSQIAKPDVKGAIYRVRRADAPHVSRGVANASDASNSVAIVSDASNASNRVASVSDASGASNASHGAADGTRPPTEAPPSADERRIAETRMALLTGEGLSPEAFVARLKDEHLAVRREAATALGRLRSAASVGPLLDAVAAPGGGDRFLEHAITFALIRTAARDATVAGLAHASPAARRAALVALDQMKAGQLTADLVVPHLAAADARLRDAALAIATAHPGWADQMLPAIRDAVTGDGGKPAADAGAFGAAVVAYMPSPAVRALAAELLTADSTPDAGRRLLLSALAESGVTPLPEGLREPVRASLGRADEATVAAAVDVVLATASPTFDADLLRIARDANRPAGLRVAALAAAAPRMAATDAADFQLLRAELTPDRSPLTRRAAAQALAAVPLDDGQLVEVAGTLGAAGPLDLPLLIPAFERSANPQVGTALLDALGRLKSLPGVTPAGLTQTLAKYPAEVRDAAAPLLAKLNPDAGAQKARLAELEPLLAGGNASRGQAVFFGKAAACATCHVVRGAGAHVGPDLSKIGGIRAGRDLLESVLFPSVSVARGYESFVVQTKANDLHAGTLAAESPEAIVLRTPAEVRIPRASVKSMRQDRVSIMPQGLDAQLTPEELRDLMAFLQSLK